jgi:hypothetical protein
MRSGGRQATASPDLTTPYPVASWSPLAASRDCSSAGFAPPTAVGSDGSNFKITDKLRG